MSQHGVRFHRNGVASFRHPSVGPLTLAYEDLDLPTQPDQTVVIFTGESQFRRPEASLRSLADLARRTSAPGANRPPPRSPSTLVPWGV